MAPSFLTDNVNSLLNPDYELANEIGRGGMAVVYRATERLTGRAVAVKLLPPHVALKPNARERFMREARIAGTLDHPGIVPIYRAAANEIIACIVMKLVEGETLGDRLVRTRQLGIDEARVLLAGIADALGHAHAKGVIHRDIKPDNIMIEGATGRPFVMDFGIARARMGDISLTKTGDAMGTPAYMSPEQAIGDEELDARSDIYSLGVIAYRMLTGVPPFLARNTLAMMSKHASEIPRPVRERRPDVPEWLAAVVEKALAKKRDDRWPSAGAFREALGDVSGIAFRPVVLPSPVAAPGDAAAVAGGEDKDLSPEMRIAVRRFQNMAIESATLVAVCTILNVMETPDTPWTVFVALALSLNLFFNGLRVWTEGLSVRQLFTPRSRPIPRPAPLAEPTLSAFESTDAGRVGETSMDAGSIRMALDALPEDRRAKLPGVASALDSFVAHVRKLGNDLKEVETGLIGGVVGAGQAGAGTPESRILEERRKSLAGEIEVASQAIMELRFSFLNATERGFDDAIPEIEAATARIALIGRGVQP